MATFIVDEELLPYTSGNRTVRVTATSVGSALQTVFNAYPQLYVYLHGTDTTGTAEINRFALVYNDTYLLEASDLTNLTLGAEDTLELVGVVPSGQDVGTIGAAVINFIAGAGTVTASSLSAIVVGSIIMAGVMIALNVIMGALMGDVEMPNIQSGSLDNSATYTFTGIKNTTAAGTPVQLVYGAHRTGGQVLALFTSSDTSVTAGGASDTYLYYQLGVSEGEIADISDVEVNKLPYTFYQAVFTAPDPNYIRTGGATQLPMYEFNQIANTTSIGRKVLYGGSVQPVLSFSNYTPVYGYIGGGENLWWGRASTLMLGMYTCVVNWYSYSE